MKLALPGPGSRKPEPEPRPAPLRSPPPQAVQVGESPRQNRRILLLVALAAVIGLLVEFWPQVRQTAGDAWLTWQTYRAAPPTPSYPPAAEAGVADASPAQAHTEAANLVDQAQTVIERIGPTVAALVSGPLQAVADVSREAMQVRLTPDGDVLMTGKYAVLQLGAGGQASRRLLFSPRQYREQFTDIRPQAMASALMLADGRYLLGGWHGELLLGRDDGALRRLSSREERPNGRITQLLEWNGRLLLAGDGLWQIDAGAQTLHEIALPGAARIRAVGADARQLLVADSGRRILSWNGQRTVPWLEWPADAGQIEFLAPSQDGNWWIGTTRGLFRVGADDRRPQAVLSGVWVTDIAERADELWVGTWKQGLLLSRDGSWYRLGAGPGGLADDSVSELAVDGHDHLWLALYGGGGWHADLTSLRKRMLEQPWTPEADPQR